MEATSHSEGVVKPGNDDEGGNDQREVMNYHGSAVIRIGGGENHEENQGNFEQCSRFAEQARRRGLSPRPCFSVHVRTDRRPACRGSSSPAPTSIFLAVQFSPQRKQNLARSRRRHDAHADERDLLKDGTFIAPGVLRHLVGFPGNVKRVCLRAHGDARLTCQGTHASTDRAN